MGGTRDTLQSVIHEYQRGSGLDQIVEQYPTLDIADVYYVAGYYMAHRTEVDAYVAQQDEDSDAARHEWEAEHLPLTRAELQARFTGDIQRPPGNVQVH